MKIGNVARFFLTLALIISASCSNNDNIEVLAKKYQDCVSNAESKHSAELEEMCNANLDYGSTTRCTYPIASKESLDRSKDNEISACATMYAPRR